MTYHVLFTGPLLALVGFPPFVEGECFRVGGAGPNNGVYFVEKIISIPDGSYPPTDGEPGCPGPPKDATLKAWAAKTGDWYHYAVCTTPWPAVHAGTTGVTLETTACPMTLNVFADGFESGDLSRWSPGTPSKIFADGFESGGLAAWSAVVLAPFGKP